MSLFTEASHEVGPSNSKTSLKLSGSHHCLKFQNEVTISRERLTTDWAHSIPREYMGHHHGLGCKRDYHHSIGPGQTWIQKQSLCTTTVEYCDSKYVLSTSTCTFSQVRERFRVLSKRQHWMNNVEVSTRFHLAVKKTQIIFIQGNNLLS